MPLIFKAGEIATCENGHPVHRLLCDTYPTDAIRSSTFEAIGNATPAKHGNQIDGKCPQCDKHWFKTVGGRYYIHVGNEWRGHGNYAPNT